MSSDDVVIDVRNLSKRFEIYATPRDRLKQILLPRLHLGANGAMAAMGLARRRPPPTFFREFWALNDVSFQVRRGETLGIIGRNGSGKSTLLQILAGTMASTSGEATVSGRIAALLELGSGFNPEFTGRDNVFLNGRILGLSQSEIEARYDRIADFADIGEFIDQPVKTYSSGMFLRLAFAVQAHIDASVVIIDEALAVGDVFFRQKCYARLERLRESGAAILLVSHSMPDIEQYCERAILLDHGTSRFLGPASEASKHYYLLHQAGNTRALSRVSVAEDAPQKSLGENGISFPPSTAFLDLSSKPQVTDGRARCIGVALCDAVGQPCNSFRQGDKAVFFYEFELSEYVGVPICGVVISNERGVIVHGKNSWQYEDEAPVPSRAVGSVSCWQEIHLDLAPGEYIFEVGLACVTLADWQNREYVSHEEFSVRHERLCHIHNVGHFSVGLALRGGLAVLTHHGIANLKGKITIAVRT